MPLSASFGTVSTRISKFHILALLTISGGRLVSVALRCIWPQWGRLPNGLPASADITSQQLAGCKYTLKSKLTYSLHLHVLLHHPHLRPLPRP